MLPAHDQAFLADRFPWAIVGKDAGMVTVLMPALELGGGFKQTSSDLLLRLAAGYPDIPPDMWWLSPAIDRIDGKEIPATQVREHHLGRDWQRWSRHLTAAQWRSGVDCLESYVALIRRELRRAAE